MLVIRSMGRDENAFESLNADLDEIGILLTKESFIYLVQNEDLDRLLHAGSPLNDHGWKHKARGLAKYLLGAKGVVGAIRTRYASQKRLLTQGIQPLLKTAGKKGHTASFLIGVPPKLFSEMLVLLEHQSTGDNQHQDEDGNDHVPFLDLLRVVSPPEGVDLGNRFRGASEKARLVRKLIPVAGENDTPVLIQGATGTGKDIVAHCIHECSRKKGNFIAVNCGAIPDSIFESELFGYESGAFTGALPGGKIGLWEAANHGTLFLDEIAELSLECQTKVLRTLQEGTIRRVGGTREIKVHARIIAASCRELATLVAARRFREDLYYRLRRFVIRTPDLNDELADLPRIIESLWAKLTDGSQQKLNGSAVKLLANRRWLGNYRELKNFLRLLHDNFDVKNIMPSHVNALANYYGPTPDPSMSG